MSNKLAARSAPAATISAPTSTAATTDSALLGNASKEPPLNISAKSFLSARVDSEGNIQILAEKNVDARLPIASITKLMTAIVATNNYDLIEQVSIPQEAADTNGSSKKLKVGETFFVDDLLHSLLIESDNDAGIALAAKIGQEKFVDIMNRQAFLFGLQNTHFVNPTGLDPDDGAEPNYSTVKDLTQLAIIIKKSYPGILHIMSMKAFALKTISGDFHHTLTPTNKLLEEEVPFKILGGKTGETQKAGKNLLLLTKNPEEAGYRVTVVLGSEDNFGDMQKLLNVLN